MYEENLLAPVLRKATVGALMSGGGKVVIIGAGGRLGAALARRYAAHWETVPVCRRDLDLARPELIKPLIEKLAPRFVVNAAGKTNVDQCEENPDESRLTNAVAPGEIAEACQAAGARLVHISTDYVFDGKEPGARTEKDPTNPLCVYGRDKLAGEKAVLQVSPEFLVIRVSWLFGLDRPSFPDMVLKRALESEDVSAIADKISCPTYSEDLAQWIEPMFTDARFSGVLHLCNQGACTWQEYGQAALDIAHELGLPLKTRLVQPVSRIKFPAFKAERPQHTAFDIGKYLHLSNQAPRPWQAALKEYLSRQYAGRV